MTLLTPVTAVNGTTSVDVWCTAVCSCFNMERKRFMFPEARRLFLLAMFDF